MMTEDKIKWSTVKEAEAKYDWWARQMAIFSKALDDDIKRKELNKYLKKVRVRE
jgi:hypothetical protein